MVFSYLKFVFFVNNKLGHSKQLTSAIKIIKMVCNKKIDEANKKFVKTQSNQNKNDNKTANIRLKFVNDLLTINQVILGNL